MEFYLSDATGTDERSFQTTWTQDPTVVMAYSTVDQAMEVGAIMEDWWDSGPHKKDRMFFDGAIDLSVRPDLRLPRGEDFRILIRPIRGPLFDLMKCITEYKESGALASPPLFSAEQSAKMKAATARLGSDDLRVT
jgi:hypothetical protein